MAMPTRATLTTGHTYYDHTYHGHTYHGLALPGLVLATVLLWVTFLAKALEPPAADAVRAAVVTLAELQALDPQQSLTPLGHHLATLPCDVRIGKMLLFACMLRCLHPVLVIAAGLSVRSPWLTPFDKRDASTQAS